MSGNVVAPNYLISALMNYNYENKKNLVFCIYNSKSYLIKKELKDNYYYIETDLKLIKIKNIKFNNIPYFDRCTVNSIEWNEILKYSKKTYVKESILSKEKGAV